MSITPIRAEMCPLLSQSDFDVEVYLQMVAYLQQTDKELAASMKDMRQSCEKKLQLTEKIRILNNNLTASGTSKPTDTVKVFGTLKDPIDPLQPGDPNWATQEWTSREKVLAEIENTRGQLEQENTNNQIFLTDVGRVLNRRNELVQFTSNILSKSHETAQSIINNFK